ncbi:MAG: hypothetical protein HY538_04365 [Deltaproteobacteria bacterium]|nr:hypothetical protein [Deltaproteobacteria bacterium]
MNHWRRPWISLFSLTLSFLLLGEACSKSTSSLPESIVLVGEEYLFTKPSFAFQMQDPTASNGKSVVLVKGGKIQLELLGWNPDYSRCQLHRTHTLYGVIQVQQAKAKNPKAQKKHLLRVGVETRGGKLVAEAPLSLEELLAHKQDANGWRTVKLLTFTFERDSNVQLMPFTHPEVAELRVDRLYLVSDYLPVNEAERNERIQSLYPKEHYANHFKDFSLALLYRMKNYLNEDPQAILERQLYDIRLHHVDTVFMAGVPAKTSPEEAEIINRAALDISQRLGLRAAISLSSFFPRNLTDKFGETQLPDEKNMKIIREAMQHYLPLFKDHPALLGYVLVDEPYPHQLPLLVAIQRVIEEIDPVHPVLTSVQSPHQVYTYASSQNMMFSGSYPYGSKKDYSYVWSLKDTITQIRKNIFGGYYWVCLQGFTRGIEDRVTRADYRLQTHVQMMAGIDGLIHYTYFPHRYSIRSEQSENFGFIDFVEAPYEGELDLWGEIEELDERYFPFREIFSRLSSPSQALSVRVESGSIEGSLGPRPAIELRVQEMSGVGLWLFLANIDVQKTHSGKLIFPAELFKGKKVYDLLRLQEIGEAVPSQFSIAPGDLSILLIAEPAGYLQIREEISKNRFKEEVAVFRLRLQPVGLRTWDPVLAELESSSKPMEELLKKFSEIQIQAQKAILEDKEFQSFTASLKEVEGKLSQAGDFIKSEKIIHDRVSEKQARKRKVEPERNWEITSQEVEKLDKQFTALAGKYLALKTLYITGQWKGHGSELPILQKEADQLLQSQESPPSKKHELP